MILVRNFFFIILLLASSLPAWTQGLLRHNWYFGNTPTGIRFNRGNNTASLINNQATPFGTGGSAVATDPANANLLFYSDGNTVYDACHLPMLNGTGLNGNTSANQPVAFSPVPGQNNKFYVFTNTADFTAGGAISVSVVDMNLFGNSIFPAPALGDLENPKNVAIAGLASRSEGMAIVPHANGIDYWLITHQAATQIYSATRIDAGTYTGTYNTVTSSGVGLPITVASFSYHPLTGRLAVSPQGPSVDAHILRFDNATGFISFDRYIFNSGIASTINQTIYDIEWSPSGRFVYLSRHGEPGFNAEVFQFDYQNPTVSLEPVLPAPVFQSYGLQMAPDTTIYHIYQSVSGGPFLLGRLSNTDTVAVGVQYSANPLSVTDIIGKQFPSFSPTAPVTIVVDFSSIGACMNTPTSFFPDIQPAADSVLWDFGDGSGSTSWSPIYTYAAAQTYSVTLTAFYRGQMQSITNPVVINPFPLILQLVQDTTACRSEFPPPRGTATPQQFQVTVTVTGGTPTSYVWSNGDLGPILTPDSAGYYYVVVSDVSGCSAYAGVNVKEYGLQDQRANIWYFGTNAGIDFNRTPPVPLNDSAMDAPEGTSTVSDRNGDVILYTDGDLVYDKTHALIASNIGGDPTSTQSALIVPLPGDETLYYIFTTQAITGTTMFELKYSLFDLKLNGGNGSVVMQDVLLFSKSTERIAANANWLIAHEYGNNSFRAYPITGAGIGAPVISSAGSDHSFKVAQQGEGYMKLGPRNNLAVALSTPGVSNHVELFTLNQQTGAVENFRPINLNNPTGQVYGVEFSPGGNKLFATLKNVPGPSTLYEYFLDSIEQPYFRQMIQQNVEMGAIQIGPDGQLYMAVNGASSLGTIQAVEDTTQLSSLTINGFALASGTTSRLGLPNFIQNISNMFSGPGIAVAGLCVGAPTQFFGTATDPIDMFIWFFGDGGSDTASDPMHTYAAAGTYNVSLNISNRCGYNQTFFEPVVINPSPPNPTIPGAVALCTGAVTLNANTGNIPGFTYLWSSGEITQTITLNVPSFVTVEITDANGCISSGQSIVVDNRPQVDLGADLTVCQNNAIPALNAQNPGANFAWTINGGSPVSTQSYAVDVTMPGVFDYQVIVTDPITTCTATDSKTITVKVSPNFVLSGVDPTACTLLNGTLTLTLNNSVPPSGPYMYFLTGPNSFFQNDLDQFSPIIIGPIAGLGAGTYSAIVTDQISGCTISSSFGLIDAPFTATALANAPNCDPVTIEVTTNAVAFPLQYTATENASGVITGPTTVATAVFDMSPLVQGTYTIQIEDALGCIFVINNFAITPNAAATVTITPNVCISPATLTASGAVTYTWTGPGIVGLATGSTIQINPGPGQFTYDVIGTGAGCPGTQSITVDIDANTTADLSQSTPCSSSVLLSAIPTGNYTYRWYRNNVWQPTLGGSQIVLGVADNNFNFHVEVVSTLTGCVLTSAPLLAEVTGPVTANITSTQACDDNLPFTLTAATTATGVTYIWYRDNNVISGETTNSISTNIAGLYKVDITKASCVATSQVLIVKAPLPIGELLDRVVICNDPDNLDPTTSMVDLDPGSFLAYAWFKNEISLSNSQRLLTANSPGIYKVVLTNSFGCIDDDETDVRNECIPKIIAPNAFRPTSSVTENKDFFVYSFFITDEFQIFVYNRWGELVYQSNDRNFKWNGGYNNNLSQPLPGGTYAYVIKYVNAFRPERGTLEQHGGVSLLR